MVELPLEIRFPWGYARKFRINFPDMAEQLFVDYHFHPNFRFGNRQERIIRRAKRIWQAFDEHDLDVVVVAEHNWKRPQESFHLLERERPEASQTLLLPGTEVLTQEGLDLVVFGSKPEWFESPAMSCLLEPYKTPIERAIELIASAPGRLAAFLPHPYTRGTTGAVDFFGREEALKIAGRIGGIEVSNNCYADLLKITGGVGPKVLPNTHQRMQLTQEIEGDFAEQAGVAFFAHGSDAHFPDELGFGCLLDAEEKPLVTCAAFDLITRHAVTESVERREKSRLSRMYHCGKSTVITMHEALQKAVLRRNLREEYGDPGRLLTRASGIA